MIKIGIIGYGKMGQLRHQTVIDSKRGKVVAICDPFSTPMESIADPTGRPEICEGHEAILSNDAIQAVYISTANVFNKNLTILAMKAGKHVFCEKPPAFNSSDVKEIQAVERETKCRLMYGFNHRQHGAAIHMRDAISSGAYGEVIWMRGRYGKSVDADYLNTWRADPEFAGGGILIDQGIHMLDLFLYLGGSFDEVQAMVSSLYWNIPGIEDNVFAMLRDSNTGRTASLHSTMTQWRHLFSLEIFLESGYMVLNGLKTSSGSYGQEKLIIAKNRSTAPAATWEQEEEFIFDVDTSWKREMEVFFDAVEQNKPIVTGSSAHAYNVMKLVDMIYENEHHKSVRLHRDLSV
jgi:predicted dehydrogenase